MGIPVCTPAMRISGPSEKSQPTAATMRRRHRAYPYRQTPTAASPSNVQPAAMYQPSITGTLATRGAVSASATPRQCGWRSEGKNNPTASAEYPSTPTCHEARWLGLKGA